MTGSVMSQNIPIISVLNKQDDTESTQYRTSTYIQAHINHKVADSQKNHPAAYDIST